MSSQDGLELIARTMSALTWSQGDVAERVGWSRRTVQRWFAGRSSPTPKDFATLATHVYPTDPALAADLARSAGTTLEALGLKAPGVPSHLLDAVVCAAAEALGAAPQVVRPVLLAAFRAARELGLGVGDVEAALARKLGV